MKILSVKPRTLFLTMGPPSCGKTTFCQNYLKVKLPGTTRYLSMDKIRKKLYGESDDCKDKDQNISKMSNLARQYLLKISEFYMTWPCSSDFIIIDSTGLNNDFRKNIFELCNKFNYIFTPIVFDYRKFENYMNLAPNKDKKWVSNCVSDFRKKIIKNIKSSCFGSKYFVIKNTFFDQVDVIIEYWDSYRNLYFNNSNNVLIIPTIGGSYQNLKNILSELSVTIDSNFKIYNKTIVFLGNPILEYDNLSEIDQFNLQCIQNFIDNNDVYIVSDNMRKKRKHVPFVTTKGEFILTYHYQPKNLLCSSKCDKIPNDIEMNDSCFGDPLRICCDPNSDKTTFENNLLKIGSLFSEENNNMNVIYFKNGKYQIKKIIYSDEKCISDIVKVNVTNTTKIDVCDNLLPQQLYKKYQKLLKHCPPFLSSTIPPANAEKTTPVNFSKFESLDQALKYYRDNNVQKVCIQPKYMGSRCTVMLVNPKFNNDKKISSKAFSRSGYQIKLDGVGNVLSKLEDIYFNSESKLFLGQNVFIVYIDGEILPWNLMSQNMIDKKFKPVEIGLCEDLKILKQYNFESQLNKIKDTLQNLDVPLQKQNINTIGQGLYLTLVSYQKHLNSKKNWFGLQSLEKGYEIYRDQLHIFSKDSDQNIIFKPFSLLKTVILDSNNSFQNIVNCDDTSIKFSKVSDDDIIVIDTSDYHTAKSYFDNITSNLQMEGIVIKPEVSVCSDILPAIKVRNTRYLTLVYGPTFADIDRVDSLIQSKNTSSKQKLSLLQYEISAKILELPFDQINQNNPVYCALLKQFLMSCQKEKYIDSRL